MRKYNFNKAALQLIEIALRHWCSPVNLPHIFEHLFLGTPLGGYFWYFVSQFFRNIKYRVVIETNISLDWWWKLFNNETPLKFPKSNILFSQYVCTWSNISLNNGSLSETLKQTEIMPVKKSEKPFDKDNY